MDYSMQFNVLVFSFAASFVLILTGSFTILRNKDCPGNNYLGEIQVSESECLNICDQRPDCAGFTFTQAGRSGSCWPKSACALDDVTERLGWTLYQKVGFPSEEPNEEGGNGDDEKDDFIEAEGCEFSYSPNHALYGNNDRNFKTKSAQVCLKRCAQLDNCLSVEYHKQKAKCTLSFSSRRTKPKKYGSHRRLDYYQKERCQHNENIIGGTCIKTSPPIGGVDGSSFSDVDLFIKAGDISAFEVRSNYFINCISFTYGMGDNERKSPCHGGLDGHIVLVTLQKDEWITGLSGMNSSAIKQLLITTNYQTYGPYGSPGGDTFSLSSGQEKLAYISGKHTHRLTELAGHFYC